MTNIRPIFVASLSLTLLATACEESEQDPPATESFRGEDPVMVAAGCPAERQIARLAPGVETCPTVTNWNGESLFQNGPGELAEFCGYTWAGEGVLDLGVFKSSSFLETKADCEVVFGQTSMWENWGTRFTDLYHHAIGRVDADDLQLSVSESSRWPVLVAVIDSVPEPTPSDPRSEHGERMVSIIKDLACPDPDPTASCAVGIRRWLGLPRYQVGTPPDPVRGGFFGSQADIAQAVYRAVDYWDNKNWGAQTPKLIINLSVGWEGTLFGDVNDPTPRPAVDAVHTALEYASCHGAVIVGAAGNEGDVCTTGPLLPGGWEEYGAPDAARCAELGAPAPPGGVGYQPLVYSIGGITYGLNPMPGSRVDGMPRMVATATLAAPGDDETTLTGTSVASAVTAGTAALVWSYNPTFTPGMVMKAIYQSGDALGPVADYAGPNSGDSYVHIVNACAALELACNRPEANCPAVPFDSPLACLGAPAPESLTQLLYDIATATPDAEVKPTFKAREDCSSTCQGSAIGYAVDSLSGSPCPITYSPTLPYTQPQPTEVACPSCTLYPPYAMVTATLDPAYHGLGINDVTVSVFDGAQTTYFDLGPQPLSDSTTTKLMLDPAKMPTYVESASISITFDSLLRPVANPLLIDR